MSETAGKTISTVADAMEWFDLNIGEFQGVEQDFLEAISNGTIQGIIDELALPDDEKVTFKCIDVKNSWLSRCFYESRNVFSGTCTTLPTIESTLFETTRP